MASILSQYELYFCPHEPFVFSQRLLLSSVSQFFLVYSAQAVRHTWYFSAHYLLGVQCQGWAILEFTVMIYHGKNYHGITIYHDIFNFLNGVHYCSGYTYSYTLHEVYIQNFNNQLAIVIILVNIVFDKQNLLTALQGRVQLLCF